MVVARARRKRGKIKTTNSKAEQVEFEIIDGKNVCPICESQKGLECIDCSVKGSHFIFKFICNTCNVQMVNRILIEEL